MITASRHFGRCIELARGHNLKHIEAAHLYMLGITYFYQNRFERAVEDATNSIAGAVALGDRRAELVARSVLALVLPFKGDCRRACDEARRGQTLILRLGAQRFEGFNLAQLAAALYGAGEQVEAERTLDEAYESALEHSAGFTGAMILGQLALVTRDPGRRRWALEAGEALLQEDCVSHNHLHFYRCAMEAGLEDRDWDGVLRYADGLAAYTAGEPLPWSDFYIARGRALAAAGRNPAERAGAEDLGRLRARALDAGLLSAVPAIDQALAGAA